MELTISVLADRPDLAEAMWDMESPWPEFMRHDPIGGLFYGNVEDRFADYVLVAQDEAGAVVAQAFSVPFVLGGARAAGQRLGRRHPQRAADAASHGEQPDAISAVEIAVRPDLQGRGLSAQMLRAMRDNAARHGFAELVAPGPAQRQARRPRADGGLRLPAPRRRPARRPVAPRPRPRRRRDRQGRPRSMVIPGTLEEWREWTGLPFDTTGPVEVPKALAPVWCDVEHGTATYVEPNVWVRHRTGA